MSKSRCDLYSNQEHLSTVMLHKLPIVGDNIILNKKSFTVIERVFLLDSKNQSQQWLSFSLEEIEP
jgi:hypothetical protein